MVIPILLLARRAIFVATVIYLADFTWAQLAIQNFVSLGAVIFIMWYKPMRSNRANRVEVFNECTILLLNYLLMCFTDFVPDA